MGKIVGQTQENSKLHSPAEQMVRQSEQVVPRHQQDQGKYDLLDPGKVYFEHTSLLNNSSPKKIVCTY